MKAGMARANDDLPLRTAAGFVLANRQRGQTRYLALENRRNGEIGLPKGHSDPGESELETALRETLEETGLTDLDVRRDFRRTLDYVTTRRGKKGHKHVILFAAYAPSRKVLLSEEHASYGWYDIEDMLDLMPWRDLHKSVYRAALFLKDPGLFAMQPATEDEALEHLQSLPEATPGLVRHLQGGARLARTFAEALSKAGVRIHVEATATGTLLHDVGRALGDHADHQRAGYRHLRKTRFAPYSFACISHFTKGAKPKALRKAGLAKDIVASFRKMTDLRTFTWEERCAALADACMRKDEPVSPDLRFQDLRTRYEATDLIDLQEQRTASIRKEMEEALGEDPLALVGLS
jgi:bis(5'-nucleosidyl)-tetraphosphatase